MNLEHLSREELLSGLVKAYRDEHRSLACMLAHLGEIEARRIDLEEGVPSLYEFCTRRLRMSNGEAFRRIAAARVARRFPSVMGALTRGDIELTSIVALRDLFTHENVDDVLREALGKTTREIEELVARLAPKPDVPSQIREIPSSAPSPTLPTMTAAPEPMPSLPKQKIAPLSEARFEVRFTASAELRGKLGRIADLMRHRNPSGDLEVIFDRAADLLLAQLEKERLGKTEHPRKRTLSTKRGYITMAVRRAVFERDGQRCTYVSPSGERCPCTTFLELDHIVPRAKGGSDDENNLRVRCRAHNRLHAERCFGREHVEARVHFRRRKAQCVNDKTQPQPTDAFELASRGLVTMGYREKESQRAIGIVKERHASDSGGMNATDVIREALAVLS